MSCTCEKYFAVCALFSKWIFTLLSKFRFHNDRYIITKLFCEKSQTHRSPQHINPRYLKQFCFKIWNCRVVKTRPYLISLLEAKSISLRVRHHLYNMTSLIYLCTHLVCLQHPARLVTASYPNTHQISDQYETSLLKHPSFFFHYSCYSFTFPNQYYIRTEVWRSSWSLEG